MRYHFYTNNKDIVVCTSTYAGKVVRGVAKCNPEDTFDYEYGCQLAKARCDIKVAAKRIKNARNRLFEAMNNSYDAQMEIDKAQRYVDDAHEEMYWCSEILDNLENMG